ncbi:MAG: ABC transporter permease [Dehalococcoidia bacterium]|nr:ABC transporter permease [Dehalococcoidia bacterium]
MTFLRQTWLIAQKDLRIFAKDRFAVIFAALFPILFVLLFSFLYPSSTSTEKQLELYVATQEGPTGVSHQIIAALSASTSGAMIKELAYQDAMEQVKDRKISGFLAFPADFSSGALTGSGTSLTVVADSTAPNTQAALDGLARGIAAQFGATLVEVKAAVSLLEKQMAANPGSNADFGKIQKVIADLTSSGQGNTTQGPVVSFTVDRVGPIKEPPSSNWILPGYLVMFVFFVGALGAESIVAERETQTLERLLISGARRSALLAGKFTSAFLRGLGQVILLWAVGVAFFNVDMGVSPAAVVVISILTVLMASAFGIMLATLVKTRKSAGSIGVTLSIALAPLGGCWWPLFITPAWMQFIGHFTPHAWATIGFNKLMVFGAGFRDVLPEMLALVAFAIAFAAIGILRFRTDA